MVIILNNDMTFDEGFIAPLLAYFDRPEIFAVTARVFDWDRETVITARSRLVLKKLWFSIHRTFDDPEPCFTFYAAGGAAAFRRSMFLDLEGFDPLFRPAYYEEVDLSYRAWRRGWKTIYEPASVMVHRRAATLGKQKSKDRWSKIICRNQVLFNLKNTGTPMQLLGFLGPAAGALPESRPDRGPGLRRGHLAELRPPAPSPDSALSGPLPLRPLGSPDDARDRARRGRAGVRFFQNRGDPPMSRFAKGWNPWPRHRLEARGAPSVVVAIPIYQPRLSAEERTSWQHLRHFLGGLEIRLFLPESLENPLPEFPEERPAG